MRIIDKVWISACFSYAQQYELETIMLIELRELLSGSQDERIEKVSIESESFDTGIAKL